VLNLRRSVSLGFLFAAIAVSACLTYGQDADADEAKSLLQKGIAQFNALDFKAAKATFLELEAKRDDLSDADKQILEEYLNAKVDQAIKKQMAAMAAYKEAEKAVETGDLEHARKGFQIAATSDYLPASVRQDAEAQLALVTQKAEVAKLAHSEKEQPRASTSQPALASEGPSEVTTRPAADSQPSSSEEARLLTDTTQRRSKAQQRIAEGQEALDQNQPERAAGYFLRALALDPDNEQAKRLLNRARGMTATEPREGILERMENQRLIARQVADVEFDKLLKNSQELLGRADSPAEFDGASRAAGSARGVLETNRALYSDAEFRQRLTRVEQQLDHIDIKRDEWNRQRVAKEVQEIIDREADRQKRQQEQRQRKIDSLMRQTDNLRSQGKFTQALESAQQVLKLEPTHSWAAKQVEILEQFILLQEEKGVREDQTYHERKQLIDIRRSEIPWWKLIKYPRDWKELTLRREPYEAASRGETRIDRGVREKMEMMISQLPFVGTEFEEAIGYLRDISNLNMYVKWDSLEMVGIDRSKEINVTLNDVTFEKALEVVLEDAGGPTPLSYVIDEGVIMISTEEDLSTRTFTRVYDIRDLIVRVPNFEAPDMTISGTGLSGGSGGGNAGGGGGWGNDSGGNENENVPTKAELIQDIITLVTDTITPGSWLPDGTVGSIRELHGQLVITHTSESHKDLSDLIKQLREARRLQVAIEARFISVSSGFLNSIGMDLDFYFNIGSRLGSTSVVDPFTGATVPTTSGTSGWGTGPPGDDKWTPLAVQQDSLTFTNMLNVTTPVSGGISGQVSNAALSLAGTFLDDIQVDFLIQATQAHAGTRSLTAPRLTLFNGQQAYVTVGTEQSYVADLDPIVSDNAIAFNPVMGVVGSGTSLQVEAVVSADRRYVTLTVWPRVYAVNSFTPYAVVSTGVDAAGNPITGEGFIDLPNITIQEVRTTVSVPDGGTLLLGGQRLSGEVEREKGVPLLDKIPIINRAFTNRGMVRDEQTLLILIKPKIIIHEEEEELQYPD